MLIPVADGVGAHGHVIGGLSRTTAGFVGNVDPQFHTVVESVTGTRTRVSDIAGTIVDREIFSSLQRPW